MRFNCGARSVWVPIILVAAVAVVLIPVLPRLLTSSPDEPPRGSPPVQQIGAKSTEAPPAVQASAPPPVPIPTLDPAVRLWRAAVLQRNQRGVVDGQSAILARESELRESLLKLSTDDPEPRVRAFTVTMLSRAKSPPAEEYFVERLRDPQEFPRLSALAALERTGSSACLEAVDRLASTDPVDDVKSAAKRTAKAVRSR